MSSPNHQRAEVQTSGDKRRSKPRLAARLIASLTAISVCAVMLAVVAGSATAAADFDCTVRVIGGDAELTFSGPAVGTTANLRDQNGWVATVTGRTSYRDPGGAGGSYIVKLNSLRETVSCVAPAPTATPIPPTPTPAPDGLACSVSTQGANAVLAFSGRRGSSENLRGDGRWIATTTGKSSHTVVGGAAGNYEVRVRGNGYSGPLGYAVVNCTTGDPGCSTSSILVVCNGALLGSSGDFTDSAGNPISKIADFRAIEEKIGRDYDIFHDFLLPREWERIANDGFPYSDEMQGLVDEGRVMLINWKNRSGPNEWAAIANGSQNAVIDQTAAAFAAFGEPVFLTFYHEPENNIDALAANQAEEFALARDYARAFRHVHDRFEQAGASNVIFVWDVMGFDRYFEYYEQGLYPGDDVVDWVAFNQYNWYQCNPNVKKWKTFAETVGTFYSWLEQGGADRPSTTKPVMIGEFSTQENRGAPNNSQTKGDWYREIASVLPDQFPRIKALVLFDTEGRRPDGSVQFCEWSVESSPGALNGWTDMAADPYFNVWNRGE